VRVVVAAGSTIVVVAAAAASRALHVIVAARSLLATSRRLRARVVVVVVVVVVEAACAAAAAAALLLLLLVIVDDAARVVLAAAARPARRLAGAALERLVVVVVVIARAALLTGSAAARGRGGGAAAGVGAAAVARPLLRLKPNTRPHGPPTARVSAAARNRRRCGGPSGARGSPAPRAASRRGAQRRHTQARPRANANTNSVSGLPRSLTPSRATHPAPRARRAVRQLLMLLPLALRPAGARRAIRARLRAHSSKRTTDGAKTRATSCQHAGPYAADETHRRRTQQLAHDPARPSRERAAAHA
jgi:hypothetical protein